MKKLLAISLLSLYLLALTEVGQLVKLPLLVDHFMEHKEKDQNLSLWDFLSMHYSQSNTTDDDDMKLPFKSHNGCISTIVIAAIPANFDIPANTVFTKSKSYSVYSEKFSPSSFLASIWQPPKSCYFFLISE